MKKLMIGAALIFGLNQNSNAQDKGFKWLFDGTSTSGWHTYGKTTAGSAWKAENNTLHFDPTEKNGRGDLVTNNEYANFHLKLEWKVSKNANSGIIFFVNEDLTKYKKSYMTGLEMQLLDSDGHPDGKIEKHRAGDLYDLIKSKKETEKPIGEWNLAEIIAKKGKLTLKLNGTIVVQTKLWNDDWKKLVAGSKFAQWSGFAAYKTGKIALQDHNDEVWFRNIQIKEL